MKALVIGGTGFIGSHLVRALLARGDAVRVLARNPARAASLEAAGAEVVRGDLGEPDTLRGIAEGIDVVFHLGSVVSAPEAVFQRVDVEGTGWLLAESARAGVRRLIFAGTLAGYPLSRLQDGAVIDEQCALDDSGLLGSYARAKASAEDAILDTHRRGQLECVILRLGLVCGPGAPLFPPHVGRTVRGGLMLIFGNGRIPLPLVFVDNVVDAFLQAATLPDIGGEIFNIVDEEVLTQLEYVDLYGKATGAMPRVVRLPRLAYYALGAATEFLAALRHREAATTRYRVRARLRRVRWDCSKAQRQLQWRSRVSLRAGLANTFRATAADRLRAPAPGGDAGALQVRS
jgi:nucleoside-diphosphate-sugar epimerase